MSKTVAKEVLARKRAEAAEERYSAPAKKPSPLLKDFVEEYLEYYRAHRRPRSAKRHEASWHAVQPVLGTKRLVEISPFDLERYRRQRQQADRSEITSNRELAFLRNLYNVAIAWGKATENPVSKVRFAREHNQRTRFLSPEEETRLLDRCDVQLKPLVVMALHSGFRKSALLSLTWEEIDFATQSIAVQAAYAKNGESHSAPMNDVLTATLEGVRITSTVMGPVFRSRKGTPFLSLCVRARSTQSGYSRFYVS